MSPPHKLDPNWCQKAVEPVEDYSSPNYLVKLWFQIFFSTVCEELWGYEVSVFIHQKNVFFLPKTLMNWNFFCIQCHFMPIINWQNAWQDFYYICAFLRFWPSNVPMISDLNVSKYIKQTILIFMSRIKTIRCTETSCKKYKIWYKQIWFT